MNSFGKNPEVTLDTCRLLQSILFIQAVNHKSYQLNFELKDTNNHFRSKRVAYLGNRANQ